jgi:spore coat-associated protein N
MTATAATATPRSRRRALLPLATLLAAASIAMASGATFNASTANTTSSYATGSLIQTNDRADQAIFTAGNLQPGDSATGTVVIGNTGTLPANFTLTETTATNTFASKLGLKITDANGAIVYDGTFADPKAPIDLGRWQPETLGSRVASDTMNG